MYRLLILAITASILASSAYAQSGRRRGVAARIPGGARRARAGKAEEASPATLGTALPRIAGQGCGQVQRPARAP
jgi:hypothetical protein